MLRAFFKFIRHNIFCFKTFLRLNGLFFAVGTNLNKRETPIVVSLSYNGENFDDLELSLFSILNQKVRPDSVVLWLNSQWELSDLPYSITKYIKNGLEIRFLDNITSYTKLIKGLEENINNILVIAETNIYYSRDWLEKLYHSYISHPQDIHVHRADKLSVENKSIISSNLWKKYSKEEMSDYKNFPDTAGGILFSPKSFVSDIFRKDLYSKYVPNDCNIWIWIMSVLSSKKIRIVKNHKNSFIILDFVNQMKKFLHADYKHKDDKIFKLVSFYKANINNKL